MADPIDPREEVGAVVGSALADRYTRRALALIRAANGMEMDSAAELRVLATDLRALVASAYQTDMPRRDVAALVARIREAVGATYGRIAAKQVGQLAELAWIEAEWAAGVGPSARVASHSAIEEAIRGLLVQGSPIAALWRSQGESLAFRLAAALRTALEVGLPLAGFLRTIVGDARTLRGGIMEKARADAAGLTDTAAHTAAYAGRLATFRAQGINALEWFSILDSRTTIGCAVRAGKLYTLDFQPIGHDVPIERPPPRHYRCRSILIGHKFPDGPPKDGGPTRDTFDAFLRRHSRADQDDMLGPRRAALWRAGKIGLSDLIGQRGETLTLAELRARP